MIGCIHLPCSTVDRVLRELCCRRWTECSCCSRLSRCASSKSDVCRCSICRLRSERSENDEFGLRASPILHTGQSTKTQYRHSARLLLVMYSFVVNCNSPIQLAKWIKFLNHANLTYAGRPFKIASSFPVAATYVLTVRYWSCFPFLFQLRKVSNSDKLCSY